MPQVFRRALTAAARNARLVLVAGLAVGIAVPGLASAMAPFIGPLVAFLLFLAALRIGPRQAFGAVADLPRAVAVVLVLQSVLPLAGVAVMAFMGVLDRPLAFGLCLMLAAAPISGSPHLAVMTGHAPAPALRQLIVGTALLPLTVLPVFFFLPALDDFASVLRAAGELLLLIAVAAFAAFLLRGTVLKHPSADTIQAVDGVSAISMAIVVVGLMSAVGPALVIAPMRVFATLAVAFAANLALQVGATLIAGRMRSRGEAVAVGISAGNRNIALFLAVLPAETTRDLLLFVGCFQIPMYLTPMVLGSFYRTFAERDDGL